MRQCVGTRSSVFFRSFHLKGADVSSTAPGRCRLSKAALHSGHPGTGPASAMDKTSNSAGKRRSGRIAIVMRLCATYISGRGQRLH